MKKLKKCKIDFCEECAKEGDMQGIIFECDCGYYHYVCEKCANKQKYGGKK